MKLIGARGEESVWIPADSGNFPFVSRMSFVVKGGYDAKKESQKMSARTSVCHSSHAAPHELLRLSSTCAY